MTEKTTRERDRKSKSRTFFLDALAFSLILFVPYLGFVIHNNVFFEQ